MRKPRDMDIQDSSYRIITYIPSRLHCLHHDGKHDNSTLVIISEARSHPFGSMLESVSGGVAVRLLGPHAGDG